MPLAWELNCCRQAHGALPGQRCCSNRTAATAGAATAEKCAPLWRESCAAPPPGTSVDARLMVPEKDLPKKFEVLSNW